MQIVRGSKAFQPAQQARGSSSSRMAVRPAAPSSSSRSRCVEVHAAKGKGRFRSTVASPQQMMMAQQQMVQSAPPVDPDNEEFVIFLRATSGPFRQWMNMSVVKGGTSANLLVKGMATEWGRKLYGRVLLGNIAESIYKERDAVIKGLRDSVRQQLRMGAPKTMEPLLNVPASDFEFAVKIRDKSDPGSWNKAEGLTPLPTEAEVALQPLDRFKQFFSPESLSSMFK